jgi:hypothetical protein
LSARESQPAVVGAIAERGQGAANARRLRIGAAILILPS